MGHASTYLLHMPSWVLGWHLILDARHASQALVTRGARLSIVSMAEKNCFVLSAQSGPPLFGETVVQRLSAVFARDQKQSGDGSGGRRKRWPVHTHTLSLPLFSRFTDSVGTRISRQSSCLCSEDLRIETILRCTSAIETERSQGELCVWRVPRTEKWRENGLGLRGASELERKCGVNGPGPAPEDPGRWCHFHLFASNSHINVALS